jgi:hypothetical protein
MKIFEEILGINVEVEDFTLKIISFLEKNKSKNILYFPIKDIPENIINNKIVRMFKIVISKNIKNSKIEIDYFTENIIIMDLVLYLLPEDRYNSNAISHEILHILQYCKRDFKFDKNGNVDMEIKKYRKYINNYDINLFNYYIYFSSNLEIDAFTQGCFNELSKMKTVSSNFKENLKKTFEYNITQKLINHRKINIIKKEFPVNFVTRWLHFYENREFFRNKTMSTVYLTKYNPIKLPYYLKKLDFIIPKIFYYDKISKEDAVKFIEKWEKEFEKAGKRLLKKLSRLYYLIYKIEMNNKNNLKMEKHVQLFEDLNIKNHELRIKHGYRPKYLSGVIAIKFKKRNIKNNYKIDWEFMFENDPSFKEHFENKYKIKLIKPPITSEYQDYYYFFKCDPIKQIDIMKKLSNDKIIDHMDYVDLKSGEISIVFTNLSDTLREIGDEVSSRSDKEIKKTINDSIESLQELIKKYYYK